MTGDAWAVVVLAAGLAGWLGHEVGHRRGWAEATEMALEALRRARRDTH